jgi:predicted Zn-ribbon and HTH transcriptional regulator
MHRVLRGCIVMDRKWSGMLVGTILGTVKSNLTHHNHHHKISGVMAKKEVQCKRCGHKWTPKVENPQSCPRCKRYDWNK